MTTGALRGGRPSEASSTGPAVPAVPQLLPVDGVDAIDRRHRQLEHAILLTLASANVPLGSSLVRHALFDMGFAISEPTVGRWLRDIEHAGHARRVSNRGRVLTDAGQQRLQFLNERAHRRGQENALLAFLHASTIPELLDVLVARRAIEREVAREAALRATDTDIDRLEAFLSGEDVRSGLHRFIANLARNRTLGAILEVLIDSTRLGALRAIMQYENMRLDVKFHREIVQALRNRDPEAAEAAMVMHVDRMLNAVRRLGPKDFDAASSALNASATASRKRQRPLRQRACRREQSGEEPAETGRSTDR